MTRRSRFAQRGAMLLMATMLVATSIPVDAQDATAPGSTDETVDGPDEVTDGSDEVTDGLDDGLVPSVPELDDVLAPSDLSFDGSREGLAEALGLTLPAPDFRQRSVEELLADARASGGRVPIIVDLAPRREFDAPAASTSRRRAIEQLQLDVIGRLPSNGSSASTSQRALAQRRTIKLFEFTPAFAMHASADELAALLRDPGVRAVHEDALSEASAYLSVPLIGADADGTFDGNSGDGFAVAIIDTGVLSSSSAFAPGAVVAEACFSTTSVFADSTSLCPDGTAPSGADEQFGPGAGTDCAPPALVGTVDDFEFVGSFGCSHGTHVASTAAGMSGVPAPGGEAIARSVATGATIIAIQVFSRFAETCSIESLGVFECFSAYSYTSDQQRALEFVLSLATGTGPGPYAAFDTPVASANMSLGGQQFSSACDAATPSAYLEVLDDLRAANVAVIGASGNDGFRSALNRPACLSGIISVGSTDSTAASRIDEFGEFPATVADEMSEFTNFAPFLDLLAPGQFIYGPYPGASDPNHRTWLAGTSMAAPHVAGAWAVLREASPDASVDEILAALVTTGQSVADLRPFSSGLGAGSGASKPRIDVAAALESLTGVAPPSVPRSVQAVLVGGVPLVTWQEPASPGGEAAVYDVRREGLDEPVCLGVSALECRPTAGVLWGSPQRFSVTARNSGGSSAAVFSAAVTPRAAPDLSALESLAVVPGNGSLAVSWSGIASAAVQRGAAVTRVEVRATPPGPARAATCSATAPRRGGVFPSSCVVSRLVNGQAYTVEIRAQNAAGTTDWVPVSVSPSDRTPVAVAPGVVTSVSVRLNRGLPTVSWRAPRSNGGAPVSYRVEVQDGGGWREVTGCTALAGTSCAVPASVVSSWGVSHQFRVQASNVSGAAAWVVSSAVVPFTSPDVSAAGFGSASELRSIRVTWTGMTDPAVTRGSPVTRVEVRATPTSASGRAAVCSVSAPRRGTAPTSCAVSRLVSNETYALDVRVTNAGGVSAWRSIGTRIAG
jgi:hypothetical protein